MLSKNANKPQPIVREFFNELKNATWHPISFSLYNKLDDDGFILFLNTRYNERFSIDDFECCTLKKKKKEKFLITMHNKEYLENVKTLIRQLESNDKVKVNVDYNKGVIQVIKLLNVNFE